MIKLSRNFWITSYSMTIQLSLDSDAVMVQQAAILNGKTITLLESMIVHGNSTNAKGKNPRMITN